jgi:hypothetical protein
LGALSHAPTDAVVVTLPVCFGATLVRAAEACDAYAVAASSAATTVNLDICFLQTLKEPRSAAPNSKCDSDPGLFHHAGSRERDCRPIEHVARNACVGNIPGLN